MKTYTLYVDGACRGNPGVGGWGALMIDDQQHHTELYGGEMETTNNRMELTAAIQGILASPEDVILNIYTDSTYVKRGITEWITNWKAKNWKGVKNPDLWQQLDQVSQNRQIHWHWIKGHAGHEGNERADQLANLGTDQIIQQSINGINSSTSTTQHEDLMQNTPPDHTTYHDDWLLNDPLGLDESTMTENDTEDASLDTITHHDFQTALTASQQQDSVHDDAKAQEITEKKTTKNTNSSTTSEAEPHHHQKIVDFDHHITQQLHNLSSELQAQINITPNTSSALNGERLLILDTETTGFYYQNDDRIIEIGAIEMINRRLTGRSLHVYLNPQKPVGESENIHGLSDDFLKDKPQFSQIASLLFDYLKHANIVAHNASFDINFLNSEFERVGLGKLSDVCEVTDTLAIAKQKHPGQKNSLDALVKRYEIPPRDRTFHGALLDAEILADVYLAMTGGQVSLAIEEVQMQQYQQQQHTRLNTAQITTPVILPSEEERQAHQDWLAQFHEKNHKPSIFEENLSS